MIFPAIKLHFSPPSRYTKKSCRIPWYVIPQKLHLPSKSCHGSLDGSGVWPMWVGRHWAVLSCDSMMESWCFILEMVMVIRMILSGVVGPKASAKSCVLLRTRTTGTWWDMMGHAMAVEDWTQTFKKRSLYCYLYILSQNDLLIHQDSLHGFNVPALPLLMLQSMEKNQRIVASSSPIGWRQDGNLLINSATDWVWRSGTFDSSGRSPEGATSLVVFDGEWSMFSATGVALVTFPPSTNYFKVDHFSSTLSTWLHWLVVSKMFFHIYIYWEQSSQLSFIFFRGVETTNQL